ncbi:ATP-binding protein [Tenggerimyces flavus]|uniref:histidine kinase n=1 Tax=Tenggerimyces flavus TaxID=1708749 RepID=A0ABV7YHW3_9ACTN|nr:ATP-binding protein [Tenggerimyces flavus]MBM7786739.1 signal transduction histidine kinase/CheY-like chemotaxis protein [Tenggerimyces flavus]
MPENAAIGRDHDEQLRRDLTDVSEQLAATNEILAALGRGSTDPDAVLTTIVETVRRLCRADSAFAYLLESGEFRIAKSLGVAGEVADYLVHHPPTLDRGVLIGRVAIAHHTEQIVDVLVDPEYARMDLQELAGFRTTIGTPMLVDGEVVGVLNLWRNTVDPFDERETAVLEAFSAPAAIAIRTLDLVTTLARKVEQLEALAEVGEAVTSSLDLDEVLATIVMNAVRMSGADGGSIMQYVEEDRGFSVRAAYGTSAELLAKLRGIRIDLATTLVGRSALEGRPLQEPDISSVDRDPHLQLMYEDGWRSVLVAPMLRQGSYVGAFVVRRKTPGGFPASTVDLLETIASQSALAIHNAGLYRELELKTHELEVASRHKSEFLASMSHELRTPLNAVIGFSEVLLERMFGDINDRQEEYLRDIRNSGRHLLELLNEILDLSKVEAGRMELEPTTFSVRQALQYALAMVRERAANHGIDAVLVIGDGVDLVETDELRFKQVVLNLVSNAVKFTPDGGHVTVQAKVDGSELRISVTDDGPGIPVEDRERIFESFHQGGRGAPKEEGTGLGLTLSRRIVELFGGEMWLDTEVGRGSTFGFTVPLDRAPTFVPDAPVRSTVVLIEDDRTSADLFSAYLEGTGIDLVKVRDGDDGLARVRKVRPSAVLLDIRLPGMDGWDVLSALQGDPSTADIPVIVVSIVDERSRGLAMGAREYLLKPVGRDDLRRALARTGALPKEVR